MKQNDKRMTLLLLLALAMGLSLVLYPSVSNYVNALHQTREIASYAETVEGLDDETKAALWAAVWDYNESLSHRADAFHLTEEQQAVYGSLLDLGDNGVMGYIEIPSLKVNLPIYHGTSDAVLQRAVGHLDWTSLPAGGPDSHCVLSGHRGLPSSKLFTDIDKLVEGDVFMLRVLDDTLTYEVDQILTVEPGDALALQVERGKDYCTLVTCTPYGINTHRLLVRGHRVENPEDADWISLVSEAVQVEPLMVAPLLGAPVLLLLVVFTLCRGRRRER